MATGITDTDLEDLIECPLCFEKFRKHRILPCGHTFCEECLKEHASTTIRSGGRFSCPSCREEIILPKGGVDRFPYNFTINKLHDMLENAEGEKVQVSCKKHRRKTLAMYCKDCEKCVCHKCIRICKHQKHTLVEFEDLAILFRRAFSDVEIKFTIKDRVCEEYTNRLSTELDSTRQDAKKIISQIKGQCEKNYQQLQSSTKVLVTKVSKECTEKTSIILSKIEANKELSRQLHGCVKHLQELQKTDQDLSVVLGKQNLEYEINELSKKTPRQLEEQMQWHFDAGEPLGVEASDELIGILKTGSVKCPSGSPSTSQCRSQDSEVAGGNRTPKEPVFKHSISVGGIRDVALCQDGSVIVIPSQYPVREYSRTGVLKKLTQIDKAIDVAELPDGNIALTRHSWNYQEYQIEIYNRNWQYIYSLALDSKANYERIAVLNNDALAVSFPFQSCIKVYTGYRNKEFLKVVAVIKEITTEKQSNRRWYDKQLFLNAAFVVLLILVVDPPWPVALFLLLLVIILLLVALLLWKKKHLQHPSFITAHGENGLIVSDPVANAVYAFTARGQGEYTCEWMYGGVKGSGPGMLSWPVGVATDSQGRVLIADRGNHRVLLLSHDGEMLMELLTRDEGVCNPVILRASSSTLALAQEGKLRIYEYL